MAGEMRKEHGVDPFGNLVWRVVADAFQHLR